MPNEHILSEDPHILLMLCDQYEEPEYKRLISYHDGTTPAERRYEDECNME